MSYRYLSRLTGGSEGEPRGLGQAQRGGAGPHDRPAQQEPKVRTACACGCREQIALTLTLPLLLCRRERITAREALRHPFILMHGSLVKRSHVPGSLSFGTGEGLVRSSSRESLSGATGAATPASTASAPATMTAGSSIPVGLPISPPTVGPPHVPVPHPHPHAPVPIATHHAAHTHGSGIADVTD